MSSLRIFQGEPLSYYWCRIIFVLFATLSFSFPTLAMFYFQADPLTVANESVAYRFIYSERLIGGEGSTVWVLAGFLTTAVQHILLIGIDVFSGLGSEDLRGRMYFFTFATLFLHCFVAAGIFFMAAKSRTLIWIDRFLLLLVGLGPLYLTRTSGFYYFSLPDYYLTNVVLVLLGVFLFQKEWRRKEMKNPLSRCILLGGLAGLMVANKITMVPLASVMLAPVLFGQPIRNQFIIKRILLIFLSAVTSYIFVILAFYVFNVKAVFSMFDKWILVTLNPVSEVKFWSVGFFEYLTRYSFSYILGFFLIAIIFSLFLISRHKFFQHYALITVIIILLSGLGWWFFIGKRPSGTTFFEASVAFLGLSGCALTTIATSLQGRVFASIALIGWLIYGVNTFDFNRNLMTLKESRTWGDNMWGLHRKVINFANGRDIIVVHPENHYGYGGVPEFLLKGSADSPTWNVSSNGEKIVHRYAPGMSFRHEYSGTPPNAPIPRGTVVYWADLPEMIPLAEIYSNLREAEDAPLNKKLKWTIPIQNGQRKITAHAILVK